MFIFIGAYWVGRVHKKSLLDFFGKANFKSLMYVIIVFITVLSFISNILSITSYTSWKHNSRDCETDLVRKSLDYLLYNQTSDAVSKVNVYPIHRNKTIDFTTPVPTTTIFPENGFGLPFSTTAGPNLSLTAGIFGFISYASSLIAVLLKYDFLLDI